MGREVAVALVDVLGNRLQVLNKPQFRSTTTGVPSGAHHANNFRTDESLFAGFGGAGVLRLRERRNVLVNLRSSGVEAVHELVQIRQDLSDR